jgi:hypothetical protein
MGALAEVRRLGLSVTARGDRLAVEPKLLITDAVRSLIRERRDEILRELEDESEVLALVERVAAFYRCPPEEVAIMKRVALADTPAARECFTATARLEGIDLPTRKREAA